MWNNIYFLVLATGLWESTCKVHTGSYTAEALATEKAEHAWLSFYQSPLLRERAWKGLLRINSMQTKQFNLDNEKLGEVSCENSPVLCSSGWWNNFLKELKKPPHNVKLFKGTDREILSILTLSQCLAWRVSSTSNLFQRINKCCT